MHACRKDTTFWPSFLTGLLACGAGLGLALDLGCWWLAQDTAGLAPLIIIGGAAHGAGTCGLLLMALVELWRPGSGDLEG